MGDGGPGGHGTFGIQQMIIARTEPEADESARVRNFLRLPSVVGLIAAHGVFAGLVPGSRRVAGHVMFADQRFLNRLRPLRINLLLAPRLSLAALARTRVLDFAFVSDGGCLRFRRLDRR